MWASTEKRGHQSPRECAHDIYIHIYDIQSPSRKLHDGRHNAHLDCYKNDGNDDDGRDDILNVIFDATVVGRDWGQCCRVFEFARLLCPEGGGSQPLGLLQCSVRRRARSN
jgi:hypothetical protein